MARDWISSTTLAVVGIGVVLVAHLGCDLGLGGGLADDARLPDVVRQRLLAVDVFAELQGRQGGKGVRVLGRADDHRVEVVGAIVNPAEVAVAACLGMILAGHLSTAGSYIARHSATIFSAAIAACFRLKAPRPPVAIIAMLSLSFRFRPRTIAGAAIAPMVVPAKVFTNWRRVGRPADVTVSLME